VLGCRHVVVTPCRCRLGAQRRRPGASALYALASWPSALARMARGSVDSTGWRTIGPQMPSGARFPHAWAQRRFSMAVSGRGMEALGRDYGSSAAVGLGDAPLALCLREMLVGQRECKVFVCGLLLFG